MVRFIWYDAWIFDKLYLIMIMMQILYNLDKDCCFYQGCMGNVIHHVKQINKYWCYRENIYIKNLNIVDNIT